METGSKLKVISLGVARTASLSIYTALSQLGYQNVFHSTALSDRTPMEAAVWWDLMEKKFVRKEVVTKEDLDRATYGREAATSAPYWAFWEELMDAYPDAKFILVDRDVDSWYPSFITVIKAVWFSWYTPIVTYYAEPLVGRNDMTIGVPMLMPHYFGSRTLAQLEANARPVYKAHRERILDKATRDGRSLLIFKLGSGWEPLCKFLDRPVPATDFPNVNNSKNITARIARSHRQHIWRATVVLTKYLCVAGIVGIAVCWKLWSR